MVLYEDTRQQKGKHSHVVRYCEEHGIEIIRQGLNVGDYQIAGKGDIAVDTKCGVPELAMDVFQDHDRFREECERARRCGIQLVVLVEEELPGGRLDFWRSPIGWDGLPMHKFKPEVLRKVCLSMQQKYGVRFRFCSRHDAGRMILEYLLGERT